MNKITFNDQTYSCRADENVLDLLFRHEVDLPFSCRNGSCQACLMHAESGMIPKTAQNNLSQSLIASHHFLPCVCYPESDMKITLAKVEDVFTPGKITSLVRLCENVIQVSIQPQQSLQPYKTGQFINVATDLDKHVRSYSITNSYHKTGEIEIHVQRIASGVFSSWVFEHAKIDDSINIQYPIGHCFHSQAMDVNGKLVLATGSGLGAALAIVKEALSMGFTKPVQLCHGARSAKGLYLIEEIKQLEEMYSNFSYVSSVSENGEAIDDVFHGHIDQVAFNQLGSIKGWEVYLYGSPVMVKAAYQSARNLGVAESQIFHDAFDFGASAQYNLSSDETNKMEFVEEKKVNYSADFALWDTLQSNDLLNRILDDFYTKVLKDSLLSPFFKGVTKSHIIGKQFAFMKQVFTGEDCYFGDRPRNAHHDMVISDRLFDYRELLFSNSCIKCGLQEPFLSQVLTFNESFRNVIVKDRVWPRIVDGEIKPIKGFEKLIMDIGCVCDTCSKEIKAGEEVLFHNRTGEIFCNNCQSK
jgi:ferredoxin-NADP reductase/ferredoxin/truncated hemoglobin YjbI